MHICIVSETYPPEINGVAKTLYRIAQDLKQLGHRVSIIRPHQQGEARISSRADESIVPSLPIPLYQGLHFGLPCRNRLRAIWKDQPPDIIYVATEGPLGLSAINVALKTGIAVTSGFHTNFHKYMRHYRLPGMAKLTERFLRKTHNKTLRTFAPTQDVINQLNKMGVANTRLLGRGVDCELFNPKKRNIALRQSWGLQSDEDAAAIFVSRIAAEKNIPLAIEAFKQIKRTRPEISCIFVGDGPEKLRLQKQYPQFKFVGMQTGEQLSNYYASGDLFIFPSLTETFGNVIAEAMASALVPVAFDYAAARSLITDSENGFLAPYDNADAFLKKTAEAIQHSTEWPSIRLQARKKAEELNWLSIVEKFATELHIAFIEHNSHEPHPLTSAPKHSDKNSALAGFN